MASALLNKRRFSLISRLRAKLCHPQTPGGDAKVSFSAGLEIHKILAAGDSVSWDLSVSAELLAELDRPRHRRERDAVPGRGGGGRECGRVKSIDTHIHVVNTQDSGGTDRKRPRTVPPFDGPILERANSIRKEMESSGIEYALCMPRWNNADNDPLGIDETLELAAKVPGLHAIGIADPTKTLQRHLDRVEDILKKGTDQGIQGLSRLPPPRS